MVYKVDSRKPTLELIEKLQNQGCFFRFHDPTRRMSSRSKSWGMSYASEAEAIRDSLEEGWNLEDIILPGKSCVKEAYRLDNWAGQFGSGYVVIAFDGVDTGVTGHDGEDVATYYKKRACWTYEDFCNVFEDEVKSWREVWEDYLESKEEKQELNNVTYTIEEPIFESKPIKDFNNLDGQKVRVEFFNNGEKILDMSDVDVYNIPELKEYSLEVTNGLGNLIIFRLKRKK